MPTYQASSLPHALAYAKEVALANVERRVRWASRTGESLAERCSCRTTVGEQVCDCDVEPALPNAYMIRARRHLERGEPVRFPPRRRCLLCLRGDHDLADAVMATVTMARPNGSRSAPLHVSVPVRRSKRIDVGRAERARAFPAGTGEAQRAASGGDQGTVGSKADRRAGMTRRHA
jgi:hypothetical protein